MLSKFKLKKPKDEIQKAINAFLTGKIGKFGHYVAVENALVYRTVVEDGMNFKVLQDVIAVKMIREGNTIFLGNSSILSFIGRTVNWGNENLNRSVTDIQTRLSILIPMVPFTVFKQAGLDLLKLNIVDRGNEETLRIKESTGKHDKDYNPIMHVVNRHFTGASLYEVEGKQFLFDVDRREVEHKILNPFLVELTTKVRTISEAYDSLMPSEVKDAIKEGKTVLRQGEWFFIPVEGEFQAKTVKNQWSGKEEKQRAELKAGPNRPNYATNMHESVTLGLLVSGKVSHSGREHADLNLNGWYKPVVNTSIRSFTITGDVD
jgi:hypothetical protein